MRTVNPKTGRVKIHTIACHDDVWKDLHDLKRVHHLTVDKMLRTLISNYVNKEKVIYENGKKAAYKEAKKSAIDFFNQKLSKLQK